jgi:hypothetical protein
MARSDFFRNKIVWLVNVFPLVNSPVDVSTQFAVRELDSQRPQLQFARKKKLFALSTLLQSQKGRMKLFSYTDVAY